MSNKTFKNNKFLSRKPLHSSKGVGGNSWLSWPTQFKRGAQKTFALSVSLLIEKSKKVMLERA